MIQSPLRLERAFVGRVSLEAAEDKAASSDQLVVETTPTFAVNDSEPNNWKVSLNVKFEGAEGKVGLYRGSVEVIGFFTVNPPIADENRRLKLIAMAAPSVLYSTAREVVAFLTGRGVHGPFQLPLVSFADTDIRPLGKKAVKAENEAAEQKNREKESGTASTPSRKQGHP